MKFAHLLVILPLAITTAFAQTPADSQTVAQASKAYYSVRAEGVKSFSCDMNPDWRTLLGQNQGITADQIERAASVLNQIHFAITHDVVTGKSTITHASASGPNAKTNEGLAQIYSGMEQMTSGFFDTWGVFVINNPFPASTGTFQLESTSSNNILNYIDGDAKVTVTFSKGYVVSDVRVVTPKFDSDIQPTFTRSPNGLLLMGGYHSFSKDPEAETLLNVSIDYQTLSGVEIIRLLNLRGTYGSNPFAVVVNFQNCQVTR